MIPFGQRAGNYGVWRVGRARILFLANTEEIQ
jgi:hypothetical protein